nr:immunoglobulin light chain junction region [Macaca mulatta]
DYYCQSEDSSGYHWLF